MPHSTPPLTLPRTPRLSRSPVKVTSGFGSVKRVDGVYLPKFLAGENNFAFNRVSCRWIPIRRRPLFLLATKTTMTMMMNRLSSSSPKASDDGEEEEKKKRTTEFFSSFSKSSLPHSGGATPTPTPPTTPTLSPLPHPFSAFRRLPFFLLFIIVYLGFLYSFIYLGF